MADTTTWTPISAQTDFQDDAVFNIDFKTKTVQVLVEQPIVAGENLSQFIKFQAPRFYDNIDLTEMMVNILYVSPAGNRGISAAVNTEYSEDSIRCGWLVPYAACPQKGTLHFVLEFVGADYTLKTTIASTPVLDSINDADVVPEPAEQAWYITLQANVSATLQAAQTALGRIESIFNTLSNPSVANEASEMVDETAIYVYTGSETGYTYGDWYYYDGTTWTSGGTYASTALYTDTVPTQGSSNAVSSGGVWDALNTIDTSLLNNVDKYNFSGSPTAYNARDFYIEYTFLQGHRYRISLTFNKYTPAETSYKWRVELCDDKSGNNPVNEQHTTIAPNVGTTAVIDFVAESTKSYAQIRLYTLAGYDFDVDIVFDCYGMETIESIKNAIEIFGEKKYIDHKIVNVDWKYFGRWDYPTGWRQGYYATATGEYINNGGYMCSVKEIDLTGIDKLIITPPTGYSVAIVLFKSDGTFVSIGSANTITYPEWVNVVRNIDVHDYVKCGITVGRFPNTEGQKGADYAANETFVNSVGMTVYYKTRNRIHDYYVSEMEQTIESVRDSITEPALVFPVITDIHYLSQSGSFNHGVENIREFCKRVKVDFVLNLGDNTDGNIDPDYTVLRNMFMLDRFAEIGAPYYQAIGNHDINGYKSTEKLTAAEIYKSYLSNTRGVVFDLTSGETNYYKDFDEIGIRLVVLDIDHNAGWTYSNNTATWLTNTALDTDNIVILAEHMSSIPTQNWNGASVVNGAEVTAVLQAFVNGGGKLIQLCGHSHADYYFTNPWLTIFTICQKFEKVDVTDPNYSEDIQGNIGDIVAPDRTEFTASEDAWTVFIIKPVSGKVDAIRFGAGNDMHYDF